MKTIKINNNLVKINYDGTVIYVNGRLAKSTLYSKQKKGCNGYFHVKVGDKDMLVHRLVAMAYVPNPEHKRLVLHKNTITTCNHYLNLKWGSQKDILANMINEGRSVPASIAPKKKPDPVKIDPAQVLELWRKGFKPHSIAQHTGGRISKIEEILEQSRRKLHYITGR